LAYQIDDRLTLWAAMFSRGWLAAVFEVRHDIPNRQVLNRLAKPMPTAWSTVGVNQTAASEFSCDYLCTGHAQSKVPGQCGCGQRMLFRMCRNDPYGMETFDGEQA
jgi:hypothetical protein